VEWFEIVLEIAKIASARPLVFEYIRARNRHLKPLQRWRDTNNRANLAVINLCTPSALSRFQATLCAANARRLGLSPARVPLSGVVQNSSKLGLWSRHQNGGAADPWSAIKLHYETVELQYISLQF
jgi:hypothetical protein